MRQGHLAEGRIALQPGIVDQDVYSPELLNHVSEQARNLVFRRHIGLQRDGIDARAPNFLDYGIGCVIARNVVHDDVRARLAERNRDSAADTGIGAGHQRFLSDQYPLAGKLGRSGIG